MNSNLLRDVETTIAPINDGVSLDSSTWNFMAGVGAATIWFGLIFGLVIYIINSIFLMGLFRKAGVEGWKAWIPIYNMFKFLQLGGYSGWLILLNLIPAVGTLAAAIFSAMAAYEIGRKLDKEGIWVVMYIFLGIVWTGILGLDESKWSENRGRPSVAPEKSPM